MTRDIVSPDQQKTNEETELEPKVLRVNGSLMETESRPEVATNDKLWRDVVGKEAQSNNAGMRF
ncbi:alpha-N-arabinofuranosidase [Sesbania bispinosa]|nr:alpha-N-arabinofuranosidase [Sesbania bispinosa]